MLDFFLFFPILLIIFGAVRATHSHGFSVAKTMVLGGGGFFFYLIGFLPFFTGGMGILLALIGILHRHIRPKEEIFRTEYQVALALLLTLWGQSVGYEVVFLFLLPELMDLMTGTAERILKSKLPQEKRLCHLKDLHDPLLKSRIILHFLLIFLSGGLIGFSQQPVAVFLMGVLATVALFFSKHFQEEKESS